MRRGRLRSFALLPLVTVVSAAVLGGCSAGNDSPKSPAAAPRSVPSAAPETGTVTGQVTLIGGPASTYDHPAAGGVVTFAGSGRTTAAMSEQGRFTAQLRPGTYVVTATTPDYLSGDAPCEAAHPVHVSVGKVASVEVLCQVR